MSLPVEEVIVLALLLLGVLGSYYALKLHYIFAFGLVQKTDISKQKKQKIEKIKNYVFYFLKVLAIFVFISVLIGGFIAIEEGVSLKHYILTLWRNIPEGFWLHVLWVFVRIALIIVLMRYVLKMIYHFLDKAEIKSIQKTRYNTENIKRVYARIHNTIKYTVVLGVVYRIIHFFPFLLEVSHVFFIALIVFVCMALGMTLKEVFLMLRTRKKIDKIK